MSKKRIFIATSIPPKILEVRVPQGAED